MRQDFKTFNTQLTSYNKELSLHEWPNVQSVFGPLGVELTQHFLGSCASTLIPLSIPIPSFHPHPK